MFVVKKAITIDADKLSDYLKARNVMKQLKYTKDFEYEMKVIISELGLKTKLKPSDESFNAFKIEAAFRIFVVDYRNLLIASEVSNEMGIDYVTAAVYYAYLIALPSAEKQPSTLKSLFSKKSEFSIDYRNIVYKLHDYVMKRDNFGEFCERWSMKVSENRDIDNVQSFDLLSRNIERVINNVQKDPKEYQIECLEVAINTHLGLYEQEGNEECVSLYITIRELFKNCQNLDDARKRLDALQFIEKSIDPSKTTKKQSSLNTVLRLGVLRKYLTHLEILEYGILTMSEELVDAFKQLGIDLIEKAKAPSVLF